ncbi:MAG: SEC-C domain-containing protein [Anaerolineae bacterium]|nr:SEC-C domain-containing protein [Anaerolineae bacterium]
MVTQTNKYGLTRNIPASVQRSVRYACGYGCVICGNAVYEYEHIDPEFSDAKEHLPENIALLCASCHSNVTRGFWSKEYVKRGRKNPYCKREGSSKFELNVARDGKFFVKIGETKFVNLKKIIEVNGKEILSISPPEIPNTPPRISAQFYDRNGSKVAFIKDNHWHGTTEAFDIEAKGKYFLVRSAKRKIDLLLRVNPPNSIEIERLELHYEQTAITGNINDGFVIRTQNSSLNIPPTPAEVTDAPFWISVEGEKIRLGQDSVGFLNEKEHPGVYELNNAEVELVSPSEIGSPMGTSKGRKALKVTVGESGEGGVTISFSPPASRIKRVDSRAQFGKKVGRNKLCPCGSGKKYKKCHGKMP